jgi:hypothetical protein
LLDLGQRHGFEFYARCLSNAQAQRPEASNASLRPAVA